MVNWKQHAAQDLEDYPLIQESLQNLPEEIQILEQAAYSIHSVRLDKIPVQGGTSRRESDLIDNIDRRGRLQGNLELAKRKAERIERGLSVLNNQERLVLERFFIHRTRDYMDRLCEELGCETAQIYRIKDAGLKKFTLAMYGDLFS